MKILQVGKYYPPYRGGMETVLENLVEGLLDAGVQVTTLVSGENSHDRHQLIRGPISGHQGELVRAARMGQFQSQPMNTTMISLMRRQVLSFQPDLVHLHLPNPLAVMAWSVVARTLGSSSPPFAIWHHADITRQKLAGHLLRPFLGHSYRKSAGICVSSQALATNSPMLQKYSPQVEVIPFGIDDQPWGEISPSRDGPFLFVGRLVPYKGPGVLLAAIKKVSGSRLDVVGVGPLENSLMQEIKRDGLGNRIVFHGSCDEHQLAQLMARARALVLPSLDQSETFGLVQLEAMASGIPVIASNLQCGVAEVGLDGETCLLVPPGDANALAGSLKMILEDDALTERLGVAARRRFADKFTRKEMTSRILAWYETLLKPDPSKGIS